MNHIVAIIQARTSSTRFPNKVFADLCGKPLIWHVFNRIQSSRLIESFVLATTNNELDNSLVDWAHENNILYFRGDENNVLKRYYDTAKYYKANIIVRITSDDPFKDVDIIDNVVSLLINNKLDFTYNNKPPTFPEGMDVEAFTFDALEKAYLESNDDFEKEHVTQFFHRNIKLFTVENLMYKENLSNYRWTIDTKLDFEMTKLIYNKLYNVNKIFNMNDILNLFVNNPEIPLMNQFVERSQMYKQL
jgi:spore coat polysaccharide biosynthesis protein SpsF